MRKVFLWLLIVTAAMSMIFAFTLSGCKNESTAGTTAAETTVTETTAAETTAAETTAAGEATAKTVLRLWCMNSPAFLAAYEGLAAAYETAHPDVDIQVESFEYGVFIQTLQTAMPAGQEADIMALFGSWIPLYAERLATVPAEVMSLDEAKNTFYKAPLGGYLGDGVFYGFPQEFNNEYGGVLVNKTLFEAANLTYPPKWETMADVISDGKALAKKDASGTMTTAGFYFIGGDMSIPFLAGIKQFGGDYWNSDHTGFTFNTPEAKSSVQWMLDAVKAGVIDPVGFSQNDLFPVFFSGKVGIGYVGTWSIGVGKESYPDFKDEWDYFMLPNINGDTPSFVADSGWGLTVSPNSKNQDIAWDFAKFATTVPENVIEYNRITGTIPALISAKDLPEFAEQLPWAEKELGILPYGEYMGQMPDRDLIMYEIIFPHIVKMLQGVETVDAAMEAIDTEANSTFK